MQGQTANIDYITWVFLVPGTIVHDFLTQQVYEGKKLFTQENLRPYKFAHLFLSIIRANYPGRLASLFWYYNKYAPPHYSSSLPSHRQRNSDKKNIKHWLPIQVQTKML